MIGYVTLGSNDIPRAAAFYDELLKLLGAGRFMESETMVAWAVSLDKPALGVIKPFDGKPASFGNGVMVALVVDSNAKVDEVHQKAIALGAHFVFVGRPFLYAAAIAGEEGVRHGAQLLKDEISRNMAMLGVNDLTQMTRELLVPNRGIV